MNKIFILGDSRTGTLSLSNFFAASGITSIHHYEAEANQLPHVQENRKENFRKIKDFINGSSYVAFSDYPTRLYYEELAAEFPDAFFILTVRRDLETWKRSMLSFFSRFFIPLDIDEKATVYTELNELIRKFFASRGELNFLELCIDDGADINTPLLKNFLGLTSELLLGWDNRSSDIDNTLPSGRYRLFGNNDNDHTFKRIQQYRPAHKGLLSEYGWVFLINDTNNYLSWMYGESDWTDSQRLRATETLAQRVNALACLETQYFKVIIPEKAVVYQEYLPKAFSGLQVNQERPAKYLSRLHPKNVAYLDDYLTDAKSYGPMYFRGDTHTTWLGAYFIYQYTIKALRQFIGPRLSTAIPLGVLKPSLAGYDGDVFAQIAATDSERLNDQWQDLQFFGTFEHCIQYELPSEHRRSRRTPIALDGEQADDARPIFVTEIDDNTLPTAVIFRDSTAEKLVDLLAEHFRRAVFIWHKGEVKQAIIEAEKPDIVLHMMAERFVCSYGDSMIPMSTGAYGKWT